MAKPLWYTFSPPTLLASQGQMQLTLLVPELIWPEPEDRETLGGLNCPALTTLLTRSQISRRPPQSLEATLTDLFGHGENAPYAALRLRGEPGTPPETEGKHWICADPVHLRFHQDHLVLADSGRLGITPDEAREITSSLNTHFSGTAQFHTGTAERWYLQMEDSSLLDGFDAPPLSAVSGRSVDQLLAENSQNRGLRKLLVESQMLMHAAPANERREAEGRMVINSLWFWGAGQLPERIECPFDGTWSTNPLARGLARAGGAPAHPAPVDAATFFEHAAPDTSHLIVLEDLLGPVQYENGSAYRATLNELETRWFMPLRDALKSGRIKELHIEASTAYAALTWKAKRLDQWKIWRKPMSLQAIALDLAKGSV